MCIAISIAATLPAIAQSIVQGWEGIRGPSVGIGPPPDPHGAPGPAGVLATVNVQISYFRKGGGIVWGPVALPATFFPGNTGTSNQNADPRVLFDHDSRRFFVIMQENHNSRCWLNVAVSRNSDPATSGAADWIVYRFDATEYSAPNTTNTAGGVNYGGDYPGMAVDNQALYVAYRMFGFTTAGTISGSGADVINSAVLIMNKAQLLAGNGTLASLYTDAITLQPVTPAGASPSDTMYMVGNWNNTNLKLYAISNPLGVRTLNSRLITVADVGGGPTGQAPQSGSAMTLDTLTGKMQGNATLAQGDIWCCMTRGQAAGPAVAAYWRIRLNGWPQFGLPALQEQGTVGASTEWNFLPSISANLAGDVAIVWTRSSASIFPTITCAWRTATAGSFSAPQTIPTIITRPAPLPPIGATFNSDGRWGDYFSVWPDPTDGSLWAVSEWTRADDGNWSTWWAQIAMPPRNSYVNLSGDPIFQNGTSIFPWLTVGRAHTTITSGTIYIAASHYNEQITLNKSVTLQKNGGGGDVVIGAP